MADRLDAVVAVIMKGNDMSIVTTEPVVFDPYDYAFQEDPYPIYARLRDEEPLHHNAEHDLWVLTRHADVQHAVRTEGVYSNAMGVSIDKSAWGPDAHKVMSFLGMDPPRQKRLRSLVSRGFTPAPGRRAARRGSSGSPTATSTQCLEMPDEASTGSPTSPAGSRWTSSPR